MRTQPPIVSIEDVPGGRIVTYGDDCGVRNWATCCGVCNRCWELGNEVVYGPQSHAALGY